MVAASMSRPSASDAAVARRAVPYPVPQAASRTRREFGELGRDPVTHQVLGVNELTVLKLGYQALACRGEWLGLSYQDPLPHEFYPLTSTQQARDRSLGCAAL